MQGQGGVLGPEARSPCYGANLQGRVSESLKDQLAGQPSSISPHVYEPIAPWGRNHWVEDTRKSQRSVSAKWAEWEGCKNPSPGHPHIKFPPHPDVQARSPQHTCLPSMHACPEPHHSISETQSQRGTESTHRKGDYAQRCSPVSSSNLKPEIMYVFNHRKRLYITLEFHHQNILQSLKIMFAKSKHLPH